MMSYLQPATPVPARYNYTDTYFLGKNSEADQPSLRRYLQLRFDPAWLRQAQLSMRHPHHHEIRKLSNSIL